MIWPLAFLIDWILPMLFPGSIAGIDQLGYQLGYLILPPVLPVAIWVVLHRGYLSMLVLNSSFGVHQ
ncbi:MAG: hypothetical protein KZQ89_12740 [Candidatus Thiodiazotropha sp. (ex Lucinoma kastoroae)]|nr:hypothetical protein [Candidatus Thiodiazotropha sp. (ex Lucinoma kastoroae)]MCU7861449.1 hypothetical protein [Candidatus Thiodiazotropha sp. (ex Lucinoma kastoroae)]